MRSYHYIVHVLWVASAIAVPVERPSLGARDVTSLAAGSSILEARDINNAGVEQNEKRAGISSTHSGKTGILASRDIFRRSPKELIGWFSDMFWEVAKSIIDDTAVHVYEHEIALPAPKSSGNVPPAPRPESIPYPPGVQSQSGAVPTVENSMPYQLETPTTQNSMPSGSNQNTQPSSNGLLDPNAYKMQFNPSDFGSSQLGN